MRALFFICVFILFISCNNSNRADNEIVFIQGIITKTESNFKYSTKFSYNYNYVYYLNAKEPLIGFQKNPNLVFAKDEPVIISVLKNDSLNSSIESRGVINKTELEIYFDKN